MKDFKIPFAVISFLAVQLGGAIWWASQVDGRVKTLETQSLNVAKCLCYFVYTSAGQKHHDGLPTSPGYTSAILENDVFLK